MADWWIRDTVPAEVVSCSAVAVLARVYRLRDTVLAGTYEHHSVHVCTG